MRTRWPLLVLLASACGDLSQDARPLPGTPGTNPSPDITPAPVPALCRLPADAGECEAAFGRFFFDAERGACARFVYGGCGGNANNFETLEACEAQCGAEPRPGACGGLLGAACAATEWCDFEAGSCGAADQQGVCRPRPEICPQILAPVCGCDGRTYDNDCVAAGAGVDVVHAGACGSTPSDACGGFSGLSCGRREFCDFPADGCDFADASGVCRTRPEVCTKEYAPVCGCDGVTYANLCEAHASGVDAARSGPCEAEPNPGRCGGRSGQTCGRSEFCDFAGELCDWADAEGLCRPRPEVCPDVWAPVCGCDGRTYSNVCDAQASGVDAAYDGRCRP